VIIVEKISPKILISKSIKKNVVYNDFIIIYKSFKIEIYQEKKMLYIKEILLIYNYLYI
jgi:hypothetical protein